MTTGWPLGKHLLWILFHFIETSGGQYHGFLIEWIIYWIESSQIKNFESIFELNFPGKKIIEYSFELNIPEKNDIE